VSNSSGVDIVVGGCGLKTRICPFHGGNDVMCLRKQVSYSRRGVTTRQTLQQLAYSRHAAVAAVAMTATIGADVTTHIDVAVTDTDTDTDTVAVAASVDERFHDGGVAHVQSVVVVVAASHNDALHVVASRFPKRRDVAAAAVRLECRESRERVPVAVVCGWRGQIDREIGACAVCREQHNECHQSTRTTLKEQHKKKKKKSEER
jgi:hypothetical protein